MTEAASVACLEEKYFSALFIKKAGIPFSVWQSRFRIGVAIDRLRSRHPRISDIAYGLGYDELSTFQRAFKRHTARTPSKVLQELATKE